MSREFGKVPCGMWAEPQFATLTDDGKLLALFLMTSPHGSIAGAFRLPNGYVADDLGWTSERVAKAFEELSSNGFVNRCETTFWVWILNHFQHNKLDNPNQRTAALKWAAQIPDLCSWKRAYMRACGPFLGLEPSAEPEPPANGSPTVPQPVAGAGAGAGAGAAEKGARKRPPSFDATLIDLPDWLERTLWAQWVAERKRQRKPITELAAGNQIKQLEEYRVAGHSPKSVINHAIASTHQGLYPPPRTTQFGRGVPLDGEALYSKSDADNAELARQVAGSFAPAHSPLLPDQLLIAGHGEPP